MKLNFNDIANIIPVGLIVFDNNYEIVFVNETTKLFSEFVSGNNLTGKNLFEAAPSLTKFKEKFSALKKSVPFEEQLSNETKLNGEPFTIAVKCVPLEHSGEFVGGLLLIEDLTLLYETSGIEIIKTDLFEKLMNSLGFAFALLNGKGKTIFSSGSSLKIDSDFVEKQFGEILSGKTNAVFGDTVYEVLIAPFPKRLNDEEIYLVLFKDITKKANKLKNLQKEFEELKKIVTGTQSVFYYSHSGIIEKFHLHEKALKIFEGVENSNKITDLIKGVPEEDLFKPDSRFYFSIIRKNKKYYFKGRILDIGENFILTLTDISDDLNKLARLTDIYDNFELFLNNSNNFVWTAEKKGDKLIQTYYTPNVEKIIGYSAEELLGNNLLWYRIIHPNDRKKVLTELRKALNGKGKNFLEFEFRIIKKDHSILWTREKLQVICDANGEPLKLIGSVADITKTKEAEEKILAENRKLRETNEAKDRFISIISHDLRSPFSSILGFTKLLLEQNLPPEKTREYVSYIQNSAESMLNLVNALLDWTRLQTGRIKFSPTKVSLHGIVKSSVEMLLGSAIQKGVQIETAVPEDIYVHGDKNLLLQVFNNLIGNAVKFTKNGDTITVSAQKDESGNLIRVSVKDTGTGIKKEDLPKLFKVDTKFTNPGTAGEKGTGLGLSLVNEIVKKHGGEIKVKSVYGKGSEFIFTLTVSSSVILLADDNPAELVLYSKLIKSLYPQLKVVTASNLDEISRVIKEKSPVLIISEAIIDGHDIFELLNEYKKIAGMKPKVIVLAREEIAPEKKDELKTFGATEIFTKPVELTLFRAAISSALKSA